MSVQKSALVLVAYQQQVAPDWALKFLDHMGWARGAHIRRLDLGPDRSAYLAMEILLAERPGDVRTRLGSALSDIPIDMCVTEQRNRRKQLLLCDMDSTLIGQECIVELAELAGIRAEVHDITERAMRGELDFAASLQARVHLLSGLPVTALETCYRDSIRLNKGASVLARTMSAHGADTAIVSGGFRFFTERVAREAGFARHYANDLRIENGALTGAVRSPVFGPESKLECLHQLSPVEGNADTALVIGDGANDLDMIKAAGLGLAYKAKPIVAAASDAHIQHTDLLAALFFQGYHEREFHLAAEE